MAFIDYGAIAFKNGKQLNHDMFMDMKEAVGWSDAGMPRPEDPKERLMNNNFFVYIGDSDVTVGFYKSVMMVVNRESNNNETIKLDYESEYFNCTPYSWWRWEKILIIIEQKILQMR